jgi:hypothetical protein
MSKQKKPRNKAHRPGAPSYAPALLFTLAIDKKEHSKLAMQLHMQVEVFIDRPSAATGVDLARTLSIICRAIELQSPTPIGIRSDFDVLAIRAAGIALDAVAARHGRMGQYGVSAAEAETLRLRAGALDDAIGRMPSVLIRVATEIADGEEAAVWEAVRKEREGRAA